MVKNPSEKCYIRQYCWPSGARRRRNGHWWRHRAASPVATCIYKYWDECKSMCKKWKHLWYHRAASFVTKVGDSTRHIAYLYDCKQMKIAVHQYAQGMWRIANRCNRAALRMIRIVGMTMDDEKSDEDDKKWSKERMRCICVCIHMRIHMWW